MDVSAAEWVGDTAAILTTISFFPQAVHVLRTRDTRAISLAMYTLFTAGIACWLAYGLMTVQWNITLANAVTVCLAGLILVMKVRDVIAARRAARATS